MRHPYTRRLAGTGYQLYVEGIPSLLTLRNFSTATVRSQNVSKSIPTLQFLARAKNTAVACNLKLKQGIQVERERR